MKYKANLHYLNEIVAEQLGYKHYIINNLEGWVPSYIYNQDDSDKEIGFYLWDKANKLGTLTAPKFSTDYSEVQELINHIVSDPLLSISTWINKGSSWAAIYNSSSRERWTGYCGIQKEDDEYIDSHINSLPLAICLAFLKYKDIEVELDIHE